MIKQKVYALTLLCLLSSLSHAENQVRNVIKGTVVLSSNLLKAIDGKSFGIHGDMLHALLKIRTRIVRMLHGTAKDQGREGLYTFDNKDYTIEELCHIEAEQRIHQKTLQTWLKSVKDDFSIQIRPFLDLGRGFKPQMLIFIEESLKLHGRGNKNSILLKWAETKDGDDMASFNHYVRAFSDLQEFLNDLLNFLDNLVSSCPKAKQQFIDHLKTEQEKKVYAQRFQQLFEQQKKKINELHAH